MNDRATSWSATSQSFELHDLDERKTLAFPLKDLPEHVEAFGFILGVQRRTFRDQDPVNIQAAELVGRMHDTLHAAGYRDHDLETFPRANCVLLIRR